jgi:hypothetical protein
MFTNSIKWSVWETPGRVIRSLILACLSLSINAQQSTPIQSSSSIASSAVATVPDALAYKLVLASMAEPLNATPDQIKRQNRKVAHLGLSDADKLIFLQTLTEFITNSKSPERDKAGDIAIAKLRSQLTPEGVAKLHAFVQAAKQRMTVAPTPAH